MKNTLIRLHTTDLQGNFDCDFQDDIIIKENTEIALHSLSVERQNKTIVIDATNRDITFQASANAGTHTIAVPDGLINRTNFKEITRQITDLMNSSLRFFRGTAQEIADGDNKNTKETGLQIKVHSNAEKKIIAEFKYSECISPLTINTTTYLKTNNMNTNSNRYKTSDNTASTSPDNLQHSNAYFINPISLGTNLSRVRVRNFVENNADNSGFILGITRDINALTNNSLTLNDVDYAIRVKTPTSVIEVKNGLTNPFGDNSSGHTLTNFTGGDSDNDCLSFEIREDVEGEGQKMNLMLVNTPAGNSKSLLKADILLRDTNGNDIPYYYFMSLLGQNSSINLEFFGTTINRYLSPSADSSSDHTRLGVPPNLPTTGRARTEFQLNLSVGLADYFGFDKANNTATDYETAFTGNRAFEEIVGADNYIIEMLNLPINTYDSLVRGRKNVLAFVPTSETIIDDDTGVVQYEPKERVYLPLANEYNQTLRNIRARIVASDYSQISTEGVSSLNILLRH